MKNIPQAHVLDLYKLDHSSQYVEGTEVVYSNMTPRSDRLAQVIREHHDGKVLFFGLQYALKVLVERWQDTFFSLPKEEVIQQYSRRVKGSLGPDKGDAQIKRMVELWDLGYLPLSVKALPEGSKVNMKIPVFTLQNTHKDFFWLTNYMETFLSCTIWPMCSAASISEQYYKTSKRWSEITGAAPEWLGIANHCFAARGHRGTEDAMISGMGHLLFSLGTDTVWAIDGMEQYYNADSTSEPIGLSVPAFEHATATQRIAYYREQGFEGVAAETESVKDFATNLYPTGIVSYVMDSEDYYGMLEFGLPAARQEILARTEDALGLCKFVVRPDSSPVSPLEVICGYRHTELIYNSFEEASKAAPYEEIDSTAINVKGNWFRCGWVSEDDFEIQTDEIISEVEVKGSLHSLWETFGGSVNDKGYKVLNKVGLIYGEAIDMHLQDKIYQTMAEDGWCVSNLLMGVGSWGFIGMSSRDSYSFAIKGSHSVVSGEEVSMQKTPKTDDGTKKSAKGLLRVEKEGDDYVLYDQQTPAQEATGELVEVFRDGQLLVETSLSEIRERLWT